MTPIDLKESIKQEFVMPMLWNSYADDEKSVADTYIICTNCGFRFYGCSLGGVRILDMGMVSCSQCPENQL